MTSTPTPAHSDFDPPAPVMGGMRWSHPRRGPDPFWEQWERGGHSTPAPFRQPPPPPKPYEPERGYTFYIPSTPPPEGAVGQEYVYRPRAYDGQTNGFIWRLEHPAPGMTVDRYTGVITWTPSDGGWFTVTLCANNLFGATAKQTWTLCVRKPHAVKTPTPNPRFSAALRRRALRALSLFRLLQLLWLSARRRAAPDCRAASPPGAFPRVPVMPLRR